MITRFSYLPVYAIAEGKWKLPIIHCNISRNVSKFEKNDEFDQIAPLISSEPEC